MNREVARAGWSSYIIVRCTHEQARRGDSSPKVRKKPLLDLLRHVALDLHPSWVRLAVELPEFHEAAHGDPNFKVDRDDFWSNGVVTLAVAIVTDDSIACLRRGGTWSGPVERPLGVTAATHCVATRGWPMTLMSVTPCDTRNAVSADGLVHAYSGARRLACKRVARDL